jgi:hypothetical protein
MKISLTGDTGTVVEGQGTSQTRRKRTLAGSQARRVSQNSRARDLVLARNSKTALSIRSPRKHGSCSPDYRRARSHDLTRQQHPYIQFTVRAAPQ